MALDPRTRVILDQMATLGDPPIHGQSMSAARSLCYLESTFFRFCFYKIEERNHEHSGHETHSAFLAAYHAGISKCLFKA
jgi:hypothetical protein